MISYMIIPRGSLGSAFGLGRPAGGSGLTATLPRLCRSDPALADTLLPDPLCLSDGHHPGAAPAVAPHPDVDLVEPAAVAPVPLRVGGGASKTRIVLEAVWDRGVTVAADEARNEGCSPQHVRHRADVEAGQTWVAGRVVEHGYSCSLHDTVWGQINGLKCAEIHEGDLLVNTAEPFPLSSRGTQGTVEEELLASIPHQTIPLHVEG